MSRSQTLDRHVIAIEDRLNHLESLLRDGTPNARSAKRSKIEVDTILDRSAVTPALPSVHDGPTMHSSGPDDPTDGMGHFVFGNEEDRAYFGTISVYLALLNTRCVR
jgi:hypothetical protein